MSCVNLHMKLVHKLFGVKCHSPSSKSEDSVTFHHPRPPPLTVLQDLVRPDYFPYRGPRQYSHQPITVVIRENLAASIDNMTPDWFLHHPLWTTYRQCLRSVTSKNAQFVPCVFTDQALQPNYNILHTPTQKTDIYSSLVPNPDHLNVLSIRSKYGKKIQKEISKEI